MSAFPNLGSPGILAERTATPRRILLTENGALYLPSSKIINGSLARDSGNTGDLDTLRGGLLMGKITSTGKYAPTILGISQNAYTSGGTTITVTAAQAVEIVRRVGTSGNLSYIGGTTGSGSAGTAGTVTVASVAFSAVNTSTGAITVTSLGVNFMANGWVVATDGSGIPTCVLGSEDGVKVTDQDGTSQDTQFRRMLVGGILDSSNIPYWPASTDTGLITWVINTLNLSGNFIFGSQF